MPFIPDPLAPKYANNEEIQLTFEFPGEHRGVPGEGIHPDFEGIDICNTCPGHVKFPCKFSKGHLGSREAGIGDAINKVRTRSFTKKFNDFLESTNEADIRNMCVSTAAQHRTAAEKHYQKGMQYGDISMNNRHFDAANAHNNAANAWDTHLATRQLESSPMASHVQKQTHGLASDLSDAAYIASDEANEGF